ncbi:protein of unknown function [Magnetospirillum gryphiswaldense MSR-1 v2]|uniref:Uncharacterized protein n=1 Tax=Magnetospirillum gryphiswaldense (strain DSM 6361 / JCM 21280 / NBRC 15271 / MSR-1) TaxID=431944 RepID=V6F2L9_MAGGM|nr:hypothetical protein [Magnetospirillum gryphiswaldense]CDK99760.1 protein of unknown function [Magnetospirillum gryphiswaldense MSR-1 v2]
MQERYLGDSHDFVKYALLRFLRRTLDMTIGVNWYLTEPDKVDKSGNNDGEKRHHMSGGEWKAWVPDLFERLRPFQAISNRRIKGIETVGVLPEDTAFYREHVATTNRHIWHHHARTALKEADVVFLDPDNGFEVDSMSPRTAPKYALYDEALDYYRNGQTVVGIQFVRQANIALRTQQIRRRLEGKADSVPILRCRMAPTILFFTLAQPSLTTQLNGALTTFAASSPPMARHQADRRIELIP